MKSQKILVSLLIAGILNINLLPLEAFAWGQKKVLNAGVSEYKFEYVNMPWWESFGDETLKGYISRAIEQNQDLKVSTLRVEQYNQMVKLQFAKQLPAAYTAPGLAPTKLVGTSAFGGSYTFPLLVSYEADIFAKNRDKTKSVKKDYESSKFNERASYIATSSAVASTYYNIVRADKLIALQNQIVKDKERIFDITQKRNLRGLSSTADTVREDKELIAARTELIDLEKSRNILLNQLAVLIGESPANAESLKRISYDEMKFDNYVPESIPSTVIVKRPDVLTAEAQLEKAGIDVKVARKELLPSLNIGGLLLFNSTNLGSIFSWQNAIASFGGGLVFPLFTGGQKIGNLRLKKNAYEQMLQNYQKTNLVAIQEVNDALSNLKLDSQKYDQNIKKLKMEEKDFGYNEDRYVHGTISKLDLIQFKENLLNMQKTVASSNTDRVIDQISLYKATGSRIPTKASDANHL